MEYLTGPTKSRLARRYDGASRGTGQIGQRHRSPKPAIPGSSPGCPAVGVPRLAADVDLKMGAHALAPCTSVAVGYACAGPQVETRSPPHRSDRDRRVRGRLRARVRGAGHRLDPPPDRSPLVLLVLEPADDRAGGKGGAPSARPGLLRQLRRVGRSGPRLAPAHDARAARAAGADLQLGHERALVRAAAERLRAWPPRQ